MILLIIAAYAGTGKTTFAKLYPEKVVDFICMPYKYILEPCQEGVDSEACKANPDNVMRDDWLYNYVAAIKSALDEGKTLLIPTDMYVLALLRVERIPYILCYPQMNAKEIYRKRYIDRGNTDDFIEIFIGGWERRIAALEQDDYGRHIVLTGQQFLSDAVTSLFSENITAKDE